MLKMSYRYNCSSDRGGHSNSSDDTRIWSTTLSDVVVQLFTNQVSPTKLNVL